MSKEKGAAGATICICERRANPSSDFCLAEKFNGIGQALKGSIFF